MVQPVPQGYPDFVRRTAMSDQIVVNDTGSTSVTKTYPIIYAGNVPAFMLFFSGTAQYSQVQITWYADAAGTVSLGTSKRDFPPSTFDNGTFRSISPYLKVSIVPQGGVALSYHIILTTIADVQTTPFDNGYVNLIGQTANGIVGGGQVQAFSQRCPTGQLSWNVRCTATSWDATLQLRSVTGAISDIDRVDNTSGGGLTRLVYTSGAQPLITLNNHDAGAQTYSMYLSANPNTGS